MNEEDRSKDELLRIDEDKIEQRKLSLAPDSQSKGNFNRTFTKKESVKISGIQSTLGQKKR